MKKFTVIKSTPNQKNGFVWTLECITDVKAFGITKSVKRTYYIGGMPSAAVVGTVLEEDLKKFDIIERAFETGEADENGEAVVIMLKWLHAKIA